MRKKRILLLLSVTLLFIACFSYMMTYRQDPLARYPYATNENRDVILKYMNDKDIDFIISQKVQPYEFMNYIALMGFKTENSRFYYLAEQTRENDRNAIIQFVNTYRDKFSYTSLELLLKNYDYATLTDFYSGTSDTFVKDAYLVVDPSDILLMLKDNDTVWKYVPSDLVNLETQTFVNVSNFDDEPNVYVKQDMLSDLEKMGNSLTDSFNVEDGNLYVSSGYIPFVRQIQLYNAAVKEYGYTNYSYYTDLPGQSYAQLGYTITMGISGLEPEQYASSAQYLWLKDNAYKYGFLFEEVNSDTSNDEDDTKQEDEKQDEKQGDKQDDEKDTDEASKKQKTTLVANSITLRYVGVKVAKEIHNDKLTLEDYLKK